MSAMEEDKSKYTHVVDGMNRIEALEKNNDINYALISTHINECVIDRKDRHEFQKETVATLTELKCERKAFFMWVLRALVTFSGALILIVSGLITYIYTNHTEHPNHNTQVKP